MVFFIHSTVVAQSRNAQKTSLQNTGRIINLIQAAETVNMEQCGYLIPNENIMLTGGIPQNFLHDHSKTIMIPEGFYTFTVGYYKTYFGTDANRFVKPIGNERSDLIYVNGTVEKGKVYTFDYKIKRTGAFKTDSIAVFLVEVTDRESLSNAEKEISIFREFITWRQTHPKELEGTYATKNEKAKITFSGNKIYIHTLLFGSECNYEGSFLFGENTIIVLFEFITAGKKQRTWTATEIWYYNLNGTVLEIIDKSGDGMLSSIKGEYRKSAQ